MCLYSELYMCDILQRTWFGTNDVDSYYFAHLLIVKYGDGPLRMFINEWCMNVSIVQRKINAKRVAYGHQTFKKNNCDLPVS